MKYYVLKINNKFVRKFEVIQDRDYDGNIDIDMWCQFTDDLNLAYKFTYDEFIKNEGDIKHARMYFDDYFATNMVNKDEHIDTYEFIEVNM